MMTRPKIKSACNITLRARCRLRPASRTATLARGLALLGALGLAAFLALLSVAIGDRASATVPAAADQVTTVAFLGVEFLNDHEDLEPTTDAERARLAAIGKLFKSQLEASGRYRFVPITADAAAKIAADREIGNCGGCEFDYGKQFGAEDAAWIVVQKVSDLILNINVYMADVTARKLKFVHSVDVRGNTDESWARGLTYLVKNYLLADQL
jgi:Protein of unknown function (DUF2380)